MKEKEILLLQTVDLEDNYKLTCMAIDASMTPTEEMVRQAIDFVYDPYNEDQEEFENGIKSIIGFAECTQIRYYEFFWEKTKLYTE